VRAEGTTDGRKVWVLSQLHSARPLVGPSCQQGMGSFIKCPSRVCLAGSVLPSAASPARLSANGCPPRRRFGPVRPPARLKSPPPRRHPPAAARSMAFEQTSIEGRMVCVGHGSDGTARLLPSVSSLLLLPSASQPSSSQRPERRWQPRLPHCVLFLPFDALLRIIDEELNVRGAGKGVRRVEIVPRARRPFACAPPSRLPPCRL